MSNRCKDCGREERGYESLLNSDGYCFTCSYKHYDELKKERDALMKKTNELVQKTHILEKKLHIAVRGLNFIASQIYGKDMYDCAKGTLKQLEEVK